LLQINYPVWMLVISYLHLRRIKETNEGNGKRSLLFLA
jgi:hypothetical protein